LRKAARKWFRKHFEALRVASKGNDDIGRFLTLCDNEPPHEYIHKSCRIAVAHAGKRSKSDPDDAHEIVRLHTAARVMHTLARHFIEQEFAISDVIYSGD
jgi:hypothetical protein